MDFKKRSYLTLRRPAFNRYASSCSAALNKVPTFHWCARRRPTWSRDVWHCNDVTTGPLSYVLFPCLPCLEWQLRVVSMATESFNRALQCIFPVTSPFSGMERAVRKQTNKNPHPTTKHGSPLRVEERETHIFRIVFSPLFTSIKTDDYVQRRMKISAHPVLLWHVPRDQLHVWLPSLWAHS